MTDQQKCGCDCDLCAAGVCRHEHPTPDTPTDRTASSAEDERTILAELLRLCTTGGLNWRRKRRGARANALRANLRTYGEQKKAACEALAERVTRVRPRLHIFGHIHAAHGQIERDGTIYVNAAICDERYRATNEPIAIALRDPPKEEKT